MWNIGYVELDSLEEEVAVFELSDKLTLRNYLLIKTIALLLKILIKYCQNFRN